MRERLKSLVLYINLWSDPNGFANGVGPFISSERQANTRRQHVELKEITAHLWFGIIVFPEVRVSNSERQLSPAAAQSRGEDPLRPCDSARNIPGFIAPVQSILSILNSTGANTQQTLSGVVFEIVNICGMITMIVGVLVVVLSVKVVLWAYDLAMKAVPFT